RQPAERDRRPHHVCAKVREVSAVTSLEAQFLPVPRHIEVNGAVIRGRLAQQLGWVAVMAVVAVMIISGIYYAITQVNYGTIDGHEMWLKPAWDGLFAFSWWTLWRHGIRALLEGALATPLAKSLTGAWKKHPFQRVPDWAVIVMVPVIGIVALAIALVGLWVASFGAAMILH